MFSTAIKLSRRQPFWERESGVAYKAPATWRLDICWYYHPSFFIHSSIFSSPTSQVQVQSMSTRSFMLKTVPGNPHWLIERWNWSFVLFCFVSCTRRVHNIIQLHGCVTIFSIQHGPSQSYLLGQKLRKQEEIDAGANNEQCQFEQ